MKFLNNFILSVLTLILTSAASAQSTTLPESLENYDQGFRLGIGISAGPVFEDPYNFTLGVDARLQYDISKATSFTFTTGFTNMFVGDNMKDLGFIPAKLGFKGFVWKDSFYIMGEAGAGFAVTNNYDDTTLILSPSIGYATKYIDLSLRYEYYGNFKDINGNKGVGQLAVRLAYGFKL